ncbi:MAG TPA: FAD:protein FMN transferase [Acidimicrobiales bacterium]|nr:FAD:protein FMN transferase [Acidimicrobiales bacterium]
MDTAPQPADTAVRFRAMGTDAHVVVVGGPTGLVDDIRRRIADLERRWSRFLPGSEVSALTARAGEAVAVSADTRLLVARAIEAWRLTGGAFDPTVLGSLHRAGYSQSFELGPRRVATTGLAVVGCTDITIDSSSVRLPAGTGFDAGGIGKGLAADLAVEEALAAGAAGVCVNLGGDLRVAGEAPAGTTWTIAVEHPWSRTPVVRLGLGAGAVATSTTLRRAWTIDGRDYHHLIDPATGAPAATDLTAATVVTGQAWSAEVLAKAVLLRGRERAFDVLDVHAEALVVGSDGAITTTPGLIAFLGDQPVPAGVDR